MQRWRVPLYGGALRRRPQQRNPIPHPDPDPIPNQVGYYDDWRTMRYTQDVKQHLSMVMSNPSPSPTLGLTLTLTPTLTLTLTLPLLTLGLDAAAAEAAQVHQRLHTKDG